MYSPQTSFAGAGHYHRKMQLSKSRNQVTANQGTAVTAAEPRDREGEHSSMHPETLMDQVKEIRERILKHGESLRWNEMQTRYALIDPLLQALGWNTADPTQVVPEFHWGRSAADYALFGSLSRPLVVIEAKSLHTPLQEHVSQAINYCLQDGIEYFAITDGGTWELYETHRRGALAEKMVTSLDVRGSTPVAEVCLNALALWRPMVQTGKAVVPPAPIADLPQPETQELPAPAVPTTYQEWQTMAELDPIRGTPAPVEIQFPDGSTVPNAYWNSIQVSIVKWLVNNDHLNESHCPVESPGYPGWYYVASEPVHEDGSPFAAAVQIGSLHVLKSEGIPSTTWNTKVIIEHVGQDPAQFKVRFRSKE